jgi:hypothetical protein
VRVLIACESSGTVREAFRAKGHDAWSCDLLPADDGSEFHYTGDAIAVINAGEWDLIICHPPCTHLAVSGAAWFEAKRADGRQQEGIALFKSFVTACTDSGASWAIENPIGIMSSLYRQPDQIIQPWMFGHTEQKATCLWLSKLPLLYPTNDVYNAMMLLPEKERMRLHYLPPGPDRWKIRSKTFEGIASAMAEQWVDTDYIEQPKDQLSLLA